MILSTDIDWRDDDATTREVLVCHGVRKPDGEVSEFRSVCRVSLELPIPTATALALLDADRQLSEAMEAWEMPAMGATA